MLFVAFFNLGFALLRVFSEVLSPLLPELPDGMVSALDEFMAYVYGGIDLAAFFTPWTLLLALAETAVVIEMFMGTYHLLMWVLRKIPWLGIE